MASWFPAGGLQRENGVRFTKSGLRRLAVRMSAARYEPGRDSHRVHRATADVATHAHLRSPYGQHADAVAPAISPLPRDSPAPTVLEPFS